MTYILRANIFNTIKNAVEELKGLLFQNYYWKILITNKNNHYSMKHQKKKDLLLLAIKLIKKIPDT